MQNLIPFLYIPTLKYTGYCQVGAMEEQEISALKYVVFGGISSPCDYYSMSVKKVMVDCTRVILILKDYRHRPPKKGTAKCILVRGFTKPAWHFSDVSDNFCAVYSV